MWLLLLVVPFLVFCWVIGATVRIHHVQPTSVVRGPGLDPLQGPARRHDVMRTPALVDVALHHIFIHVPTTSTLASPATAWPRPPTRSRRVPGIVSDHPYRVRDFLRSARECRLYDFETGVWMRRLPAPHVAG